jgi:hypothetical protein
LPSEGAGVERSHFVHALIVTVFHVAVPFGVVTVRLPLFAFDGTVTVSFNAEFTLNFEGTPWNVTDVAPLKFLPSTTMVPPVLAAVGVTFAIVGTGALIVRKPYFSIHA